MIALKKAAERIEELENENERLKKQLSIIVKTANNFFCNCESSTITRQFSLENDYFKKGGNNV